MVGGRGEEVIYGTARPQVELLFLSKFSGSAVRKETLHYCMCVVVERKVSNLPLFDERRGRNTQCKLYILKHSRTLLLLCLSHLILTNSKNYNVEKLF